MAFLRMLKNEINILRSDIRCTLHKFKVDNLWFKCNNHNFLNPDMVPGKRKGPYIFLSCLFFTFSPSVLQKCWQLFLFRLPPACFLLFALLSFHLSSRPAAVMLLRQHEIVKKMDSCCFTPFSTVFKQWKIETKSSFSSEKELSKLITFLLFLSFYCSCRLLLLSLAASLQFLYCLIFKT